jgi:hypothetical protein
VIGEAVDTVITLGWALTVTVAWACRGLWRGVAGVVALAQHSQAPALLPEPQKPAEARLCPSWAQPDREEAA